MDKQCVEHVPLGRELISQGCVGPWGPGGGQWGGGGVKGGG